MLRLSENMAWTLHSAFVTGRATVTFRAHPGPRLLWGGVELQPSNIIRHNEAETAFQRASGPTSWGAMSLPMADMVSVGAAMAGIDPDAAERPTDPQPPTVRDSETAAAARGGRGADGKCSGDYRQSRCRARAGTGVDRSDDRLHGELGGAKAKPRKNNT